MSHAFEALERTARFREGTASLEDLRTVAISRELLPLSDDRTVPVYVCDCRCRCHLGRCGKPIDLETIDCDRACRAAHILGRECDLDELRERQGSLHA